ncbi:MAG: HYR domain-containing protein [Verrucomicrobiota bacterium]
MATLSSFSRRIHGVCVFSLPTTLQVCLGALLLLGLPVLALAEQTTVNFDTGSRTLVSESATPLSGGNSADGDGFAFEIGYYTAATDENKFAGDWVPLTGRLSKNTAFSKTSIGDQTGNGGTDGKVALSLTFTADSVTTGNDLPLEGTFLAVRFFNATSSGSATYYNTVSCAIWIWKTPVDQAADSDVFLSLDDSGLEWLGGNSTAFATKLPMLGTNLRAISGITVPNNLTAEATSSSGALVQYTMPTIPPNMGITSLEASQASGTVFPVGTNTVTLTAKDGAGNVSTASFTVTVTDTTAPVFTNVPANIAVQQTSLSGATFQYTMPTASDSVGVVSLTTSKESGSVFPLGETSVTFTAKDAANNTSTASFKVTVVASNSPIIQNVPTNQTLEATGPSGRVVTYSLPSAIDNSGILSVTSDYPSGSTFRLGTTRVTVTAINTLNVSSRATFDVSVVDTTPPVLASIPQNLTVEATSANGATVAYTLPTMTDTVGGGSIFASPASGSLFPIGATPVTITAKDGANNTTTASFTVTVRDSTGPVIQGLPQNITQEATSAGGATVVYTLPTMRDAVGGGSLSASPASGSLFPIGATPVTITAKDGANNTTTASFIVTVRDTTPPVIQGLPQDITKNSTDDSGVTVSYEMPTMSDAVGGGSISASPASGSLFPVGVTKVTVTAKDGANNTSTATFKVTVKDLSAPIIENLPSDQIVEATSSAGATVSYTMPTMTSVVQGGTITATPASHSVFPIGVTTVNVTARNGANKTSTASFTVTVRDTTAPLFGGTLATQILDTDAEGKVSLPDYTKQLSVTDAVGVSRIEQTPVAGTSLSPGTRSIELAATDAVGNRSSTFFNVEVREFPKISTQPNSVRIRPKANVTLIALAQGYAPLSYQWKKDGQPLNGETSSTLNLQNVQAAQTGEYTLTVSNSVGSVESAVAKVDFLDWKTASGVYQAILEHDNSGAVTELGRPARLTVTVTSAGTFSGKLEYMGLSYPVSGIFAPQLTYQSAIIRRGRNNLAFELRLQPLDGKLLGAVSEVGTSYRCEAAMVAQPVYAAKHVAPESGRFTVVFNPASTLGDGPSASGYAVAVVMPTGSVTLVGRLADGSLTTCSSLIQSNGSIAYYVPLYSTVFPTVGYMAGTIGYLPSSLDHSVTGKVEWNKPKQSLKGLWAAGFVQTLELDGSVYMVPQNGNVMKVSASDVLKFSTTQLGAETVPVSMNLKNTFVVTQPGTSGLRLSVNSPTGLISGTLLKPGSKTLRPFYGVVLQDRHEATGFAIQETTTAEWSLLQTNP